MKWNRRWITGAIVAVAVLLLVWSLRPSPIEVEVGSVRRGPLVVYVEEQGLTRARDSFVVAAPITGRLLRTEVDEGDQVEERDVLARMLPPPEDRRQIAALRAELAVADARQREAEANLSEAESAHASATREAARRDELFKKGAVSTETQEQYALNALAAEARLRTARATLRAAIAEVERISARLSAVDGDADAEGRYVEIVRAPVAGTVLFVHEESERVVPAGTPIVDIGDPGKLEIVVDLLTEEAVRVRPGASVLVTGWGGDFTIHGTVRYVEPKGFEEISALGVKEQRVNVIIDPTDAPDALGAQFRVEVAIATWQGDDVLSVPTSALFRAGRGWSVFVVRDGVARRRAIEIDHRGSERAEVVSGLQEGDEVIVFPSDLVEEGVRVTARPSEDEAN